MVNAAKQTLMSTFTNEKQGQDSFYLAYLPRVDKTLTKEYMMNNGYSKQIYDTVNISRARALGEEFYSSQELELKNSSKTKRFFKKLQYYIDIKL